MSKAVFAVFHVSIVTILFSFIFLCSADAQIAPTNSATISGSVNDGAGKPIANAEVTLSGPKSAVTRTDAQGLFVFVGTPFGMYQISAAAAGLGTAVRSISVQGDTNVAIQYEPLSAHGLKVIAQVSSIANAQFNVTPASVTQVNPIVNAFEGETSWRKILEQIPGVAQAGLGNGRTIYAGMPDSPLVPVQIAINGALPYETATLLDDMPLIGHSGQAPAGSGTDLSAYPLNGFDVADVVRGPGANAPSIVDSIGGSFVLHTPGIIATNHYDLSLSTDPYGGITANALVATHWKKLSALVTYGVNDSPGPITSGIPLPSSFSTLSTVSGQPFSAYSPPCSQPCFFGYLFNPNYSTGDNFFGNLGGIYGSQAGLLACCGNAGSTAWNQHGGSLALTYAFSASVSAELFYAGENLQQKDVDVAECTVNFAPPSGYAGGIAPGQYPISIAAANAYAPRLDTQSSSLLEEKVVARIGSGVLRLAALQNRTFTSESVSQITQANAQLYGAGYLNGSSTLTYFNGGTYNITFNPSSFSIFGRSDNRDFLVSYTTPLGEYIHVGASFVKSYYDIPSYCIFDSTLSSAIPSAISQTTEELRVFAGGNPTEKTSLDLSMYFANANYHIPDPNNPAINTSTYANATYTDARYSYAAPRLGFVWHPTAAVAVRAAMGGGFAEAPLNDLVAPNGACLPSATTCSIGLNNLNLQPEKSFAVDLGTDIRLHRNMVVSFDIYRSNLYGQIYQSTTLLGLGTCPGNTTAPCYANQWGNLGTSRYEGVLLDLRHDVPHGLYWSASGGLTRGYVVNIPAGFYNTAACTNCTNLTVVPNVNFNGTFAASIPYAQGLGTIGYRWNPSKYVDVVGTYFGNNNTYFRPAFVEFDGHVGYPLTKNISLLATFRNITGIYDGALQAYAPVNMIGAPTIAGLPFPLYGEMYGPRTVIVTLHLHY